LPLLDRWRSIAHDKSLVLYRQMRIIDLNHASSCFSIAYGFNHSPSPIRFTHFLAKSGNHFGNGASCVAGVMANQ